MRLVFLPIAKDGSRRVVVHRSDNVTLEMRSYDRKFRVPHDLAHAVTERELQLGAGVFGCIAAGAVFSSMRVISGSPRHDATARSARIIKANARALSLAEVLSGIVHDTVEGSLTRPLAKTVREAWGSMEERPFPYTDATLAATVQTLKTLAERWSGLGPNEGLDFAWPTRLTAPIPATRR
ncbi:MAG TPA: hypothetical protein VHJ83_00900 [Micromonosporaceae bacterium]|jgi:hypothetical protein|nr:hypothetical protein [Micromonosporaceae bacterium]